ncbi:MAG: helix-turn-helix transcriptional regulator [Colwellia sp.]|nr:helix-turn-helix transcriptional regulator [Colwellia sp.]
MSISARNYKQLLDVTECLSYGLDSAKVRLDLGEALLKLLDADYFASYVWNSEDRKFGEGVSINMDEKNLMEYEQYYQFHDPITHELKKRKRATCVNEVIEQKDLEKTEFYNDFLCHDGLHWGLNLYAYDGRNNIGDIRIWRNKKRQTFDSSSAQLLQMIRPHFINSLRNINHHNSEKLTEDIHQNTPIITASWDSALIAKLFSFTARESEIVRELLRGKKDEEIAKELYIACSTLRTHIRHIYAKTEVHNRTSLCHKVLNKLTGFA